MGISSNVKDVADFGCGYGTFTIPVARILSGIVYAIDIDSEMIKLVNDKLLKTTVRNVETVTQNILREGSELIDKSVD